MVQGDVRARATPLVIHVRLRVANGSSSRPVTSRREIGSPCTHQAVGRCDTATATGRPAGRARSAVRLLLEGTPLPRGPPERAMEGGPPNGSRRGPRAPPRTGAGRTPRWRSGGRQTSRRAVPIAPIRPTAATIR